TEQTIIVRDDMEIVTAHFSCRHADSTDLHCLKCGNFSLQHRLLKADGNIHLLIMDSRFVYHGLRNSVWKAECYDDFVPYIRGFVYKLAILDFHIFEQIGVQ